MKEYIKGANPYMPLWEHVPDGEPRVFTHNGETRVYVYGSHDSLRDKYCGEDYVVWSAPIDDLTNWRYDGEIFRGSPGNILYAPDIVKKNDTYYLYIAMKEGTLISVAKSKSPTGPFENVRRTDFGFDIGVLVDDDGRCYAYWGFKKCFGAEMNEDMATIKEGTLRCNMIPHCGFRDNLWDVDNIDDEFSYFEAPSIRKVMGKYVLIYSKRDMVGNPDEGKNISVNGYLDYAYSDNPLFGWIHGGTISNNTGALIIKGNERKRAYRKCNNHGSICEVNGKWYVFYHRGTGRNEFSRQAMLEPIEVGMSKDGNLYIGLITYDLSGEPIACEEAEMTSQGAHINGLDATKIISAGYACYIDSEMENERAYIKPVYDSNNASAPIVNISNKTVIGFKYINFGMIGLETLSLRACSRDGEVRVRISLNSPDSEPVGEFMINGHSDYYCISCKTINKLTDKHSLYFTFEVEDGTCEFDWFTFD